MMAGLKLTLEQTIRLIELYGKEECLYNKKHVDYSNSSARLKALESINKKMRIENTTVEQIKKKLKSLRSTYRINQIEMNKMKKISGNENYRPKLKWYDLMESVITNDLSENYVNSQPSTSSGVNPQSQEPSSNQITVDQPGLSPRKIPRIAENGVSENYVNSQPSASFAINPQPQGPSSDQVTIDENQSLQVEADEDDDKIMNACGKLITLILRKFSCRLYHAVTVDIMRELNEDPWDCEDSNHYNHTQNFNESIIYANGIEAFSHYIIKRLRILTGDSRVCCMQAIFDSICKLPLIVESEKEKEEVELIEDEVLIAYGEFITLIFKKGDIGSFMRLKGYIQKLLGRNRLRQHGTQCNVVSKSYKECIKVYDEFEAFSSDVVHQLRILTGKVRFISMSEITGMLFRYMLRLAVIEVRCHFEDKVDEDEIIPVEENIPRTSFAVNPQPQELSNDQDTVDANQSLQVQVDEDDDKIINVCGKLITLILRKFSCYLYRQVTLFIISLLNVFKPICNESANHCNHTQNFNEFIMYANGIEGFRHYIIKELRIITDDTYVHCMLVIFATIYHYLLAKANRSLSITEKEEIERVEDDILIVYGEFITLNFRKLDIASYMELKGHIQELLGRNRLTSHLQNVTQTNVERKSFKEFIKDDDEFAAFSYDIIHQLRFITGRLHVRSMSLIIYMIFRRRLGLPDIKRRDLYELDDRSSSSEDEVDENEINSEDKVDENEISSVEVNIPSKSFAVKPQPQGTSSDQVTVDKPEPSPRKLSRTAEMNHSSQVEGDEALLEEHRMSDVDSVILDNALELLDMHYKPRGGKSELNFDE